MKSSPIKARIPICLVLGLALALLLGGCLFDGTEDEPEYLPLNDSEYPYGDIPRVVIETEDFAEIRDVETEHEARLQIYGNKEPVSKVYKLKVRGRGNSSAKMPKYGLKLEFRDKEKMFGMPKNRDWALIANYGDKTHLRNFMMSRISEWLGARFTPKMQFVELYLNRKYMGLYLFSETVKVGKHRVNIAENDSTFLFEKEDDMKLDPPYVTSSMMYTFHIKSPKDVSDRSAEMLKEHLSDFELFLQKNRNEDPDEMGRWLDMDDYLLYYWVQEFSKNEDGAFARSVYMTWSKGEPIHFGPLWDFDLAFGNASRDYNKSAESWFIRIQRWNRLIFNDESVRDESRKYWKEHKDLFHDLMDSVPVYRSMIDKAIRNEYKRWPIIRNTENWALKDPYDSYDEAVGAMVKWMEDRYNWICGQFEN